MILFVATGDGIGRIETDGESARSAIGGPRAQCVAVGHGAVYAGCRGRGLWRSGDAGRTFEDCRLPEPDVFSVAIGPAGTVYAGCEPSRLFRSDGGGASWRELDALQRIPSRPSWSFPPRPWTSHVRWIAPNPADAELLLVGIELGGLMWSGDGGASFEDHRPGAKRDVHSLAWHRRATSRAYEAGGDGSAWSEDGGRTWQAADDGRDRHYTWAVAADPDDADLWFVSASPGPFNAHRPGRAEAYVYRRRGDEPWQRLEGGLPQPLDAMPYALLFADGTLWAGLSDGRLYASDDRGDAWREVELKGERPTAILALAAA
jgi:hypothetical protein